MLFEIEFAMEETIEVGREKGLSDERTGSSSSLSLALKYGARDLLHCEQPLPVSAIHESSSKHRQQYSPRVQHNI
jgi:hypothetical protein